MIQGTVAGSLLGREKHILVYEGVAALSGGSAILAGMNGVLGLRKGSYDITRTGRQ